MPASRSAIAAEVDAILALPRDRAKVMAEAAEMRAMIEKEKPPRDLWDLKLVPGGLIDLEFIAQVRRADRRRRAGRRGRPAPAKSWRGLRRASPIPRSGRNWPTPIALYSGADPDHRGSA